MQGLDFRKITLLCLANGDFGQVVAQDKFGIGLQHRLGHGRKLRLPRPRGIALQPLVQSRTVQHLIGDAMPALGLHGGGA